MRQRKREKRFHGGERKMNENEKGRAPPNWDEKKGGREGEEGARPRDGERKKRDKTRNASKE